MKRTSFVLALSAGLLCAAAGTSGCARKSSRAAADAGATTHAAPGTAPAPTDAGAPGDALVVSGPAVRTAENCPPSDPIVAPHRAAGRGRLVARGRGFDYDVADAPMVCGTLHTATNRAFPSGRGTLWSVCASALRVRIHSHDTLGGRVALNAAAAGSGARVEISARVGNRVYELDEGAPATLELDRASGRHTFKARMRRVDSPVEKFELSVEGRCGP